MDRQDADHPAAQPAHRSADNSVAHSMLPDQPIGRRSLLKGAGAGALAVGAGGFLAACGSNGIKGAGGSSATGTINIGFITPLTGALAGFASGDKFVLSQIKATSAYKNGFKVGGKKYKVDDRGQGQPVQPDPGRPGRPAADPPEQGGPDPHHVHPRDHQPGRGRSARSRARRACPRSSRGSRGTPAWAATRCKPTQPFKYCTMFFFGLKEFARHASSRCGTASRPTRSSACQYPNDADGNAFRDGFEPLIKAVGLQGGRRRRLRRRHHRLHLDDHSSRTSTREIFSNCAAAARLQHVLEAGLAAGLQAQAGHRGQGAAVPRRHRGARRPGQQHRHRLVVGPVHALQVLADGVDGQAAWPTPTRPTTGKQWLQSHRLHLLAVRGGQGGVQRGRATRTTRPRWPTRCTRSATAGMCGALNFAGAARRRASGSSPPVGVQWKKGTASSRSR